MDHVHLEGIPEGPDDPVHLPLPQETVVHEEARELIAHCLVLRQLQSPTPENRDEARDILNERFDRLAAKSPKARRVQGR